MTKITDLAAASLPLDPTDLVEVVQQVGSSTPVNKKVPVSALGGGGGGGDGRLADGVDHPDQFADFYGADTLGIDQEFDGSGTTPPTSWAWINQGAATYKEAAGVGFLALPSTSINLRGIQRAVPSGSSWDMIAKLTGPVWSVNWMQHGVHLTDGTKLVVLQRVSQSHEVSLSTWNTVTGGPTTGWGSAGYRTEAMYMRIRKNSGTSYDFGWSPDGMGWHWVSTARDVTAHLTPTHIGFHGNTQGVGAMDVACHWMRFR